MTQLIEQVKQYVQQIRHNEKGATMVEYALMVALIAVVCILAVTNVGTEAQAKFTSIANAL